MMTPKLCQAVSVEVKEGQNQIVKLNISSPGVEDSVSVSPASGYVFSQSPYLADNPSGLWWDAGGNTFKVSFPDSQVLTADMTVAGKLKKTGGGGGGGGSPEEFDFTQPGTATLTGYVRALFEKPDETWVMASPDADTVDCRVRFSSQDGTVGEPSGRNYTWSGDNLGTFGSTTFADQCDSFTYTVSQTAAGKQGKIQGEFTGLSVGGSGNFSAKASSIVQKAFKVELDEMSVTRWGGTNPYYEASNYRMRAHALFVGAIKMTPKPDGVAVDLRMPQTVSTYGETQFKPTTSTNMVWYSTSGSQWFDAFMTPFETSETSTGHLQRADDIPGHAVPSQMYAHYKSMYRADDFVILIQAKVGSRDWRTYGRNTWSWSASHTNGSPSLVASSFTPNPTSLGSASSVPTPSFTPRIIDLPDHWETIP